GKTVLGYTEAELRARGSGYQFIHAADMLHCAENHVRMMKTGESGLTVFRLLTKENRWKWVQANARLVYKHGSPEYIIVTQRPLLDEEGGEHLQKRSMHLPFTFATGEALLYQSTSPLQGFPAPFQSKGKTNSSSLGHSEDSSSLDAGRGAWSVVAPQISSRRDGVEEELVDFQQEDPLLATLDSLSIQSDESCSNNELFSALEGLGLNAEDLELLLLDERMVMVNMDPEQALSSCLSNEILSYVHATLVSKQEEGQQVCPLPGPSSSPRGDTTTYQPSVEVRSSQDLPQDVLHPNQPPKLLWEQPLPAQEEEVARGSTWRPAEEEDLLCFLGDTPWDKTPRAGQLEGDLPSTNGQTTSSSLPTQPRGDHLVPQKQLSPVPSVAQHLFPSFRSISSPLETPLSSYSSTLSHQSRQQPQGNWILPNSPMGLPGDPQMLGGSLAPPCQPQPGPEVLPDRASSHDFCL
ncbi:PREDICTED: aryl hydrocarbon receptor-like, partial [Merops nubicus]|uniref:aryl hydrocarbon receptor-like n=1 Tax=Merops nubicus TaxID=57421 RepID=UPI0004F00288